MPTKTNFVTDKIARQSPYFPQAVIAGDFIFLSGTSGFNPQTGQLIDDTFENQLRQAFLNIGTILEEAGSSLKKMVKVTIWMVSGNDFALVNKVYAEIFGEESPARSTPQVMPFPGGILVSVECIAMAQ